MVLEWLQTLTPQQASVVSTAVGIPIGFLTLVSGALVNSHLNRKRDDRLRRMEALGVATALLSEVRIIMSALEHNVASLRDPEKAGDATNAYVPEMATEVWDAMVSKVTMLDGAAIKNLLNAYGALPVYMDALGLKAGKFTDVGGKRLHVEIPLHNAKWVAGVTANLLPAFRDAEDSLSKECSRLSKR